MKLGLEPMNRGQIGAVLDPLLQAVRVDRIAEVAGRGDIVRLLERGRETDLGGRLEVLEHPAPGRVGGRAAAVALVDGDEIEERGRELLEDIVRVLGAGDSLVEREVDLEGLVDVLLPDLLLREALLARTGYYALLVSGRAAR